MIQSIVVFVLIALCIGYVGRQVYCFLRNDRGASHRCADCKGCALKELNRRR